MKHSVVSRSRVNHQHSRNHHVSPGAPPGPGFRQGAGTKDLRGNWSKRSSATCHPDPRRATLMQALTPQMDRKWRHVISCRTSAEKWEKEQTLQ